MKVLLIGLGLFLLMNYWPHRPIWEDGNLRVYKLDGEYMLGDYTGGGYFRKVDGQVMAVGINEKWVVALRQGGHFYILEKPGLLEPEGPFTREEYEREVTARGLPPFTWRNRWVKP